MSKEEKRYTGVSLITIAIVYFLCGILVGGVIGFAVSEGMPEGVTIQNSTEETSPKLILDKDIVTNTCIDAGADSGIISLSGNTYCIIEDRLEPVEIVCINEHCGIVGFEEDGE